MNARTVLLGVLAVAGSSASLGAQCQVEKILASDREQGDQFGNAISVSGDWMIVGAYLDDDLGLSAGAAYLFQRQGATWVEVQKIHASDGTTGDQFGVSVGISGDRAVIGANVDAPLNLTNAGSAYVFERTGSTWTEIAKLIASDASPGDQFGEDVAISGNRILIGVSGDDAPWLSTGSAYVFERSGSDWTQTAKLVASDASSGDGLGSAISLEGDRAAIAATGHDGPGGQSDTGCVYIFEYSSSAWVQAQTLFPSDPQDNQYFGVDVSLSGSTIIVGAFADDTFGLDAGAAYVFQEQLGTWSQVQELTTSDGGPFNQFASSVRVVGDMAVIGSAIDTDPGFACGSAYVFRRSGSTWMQFGKMLAPDPAYGDIFGLGLAISGDTALVCAQNTDDLCPGQKMCNNGSVYVFEFAPTAIQYGSCKTLSPCGNLDDHGGCRNSAGQGAVIAACGSGSVTTDDLRLEATRCPPNKLTLLFMGPSQAQALYGDGLRVASAQNPVGIYRFGGAAANAQGRVMRGPGLVAHSQGFQPLGRIQAGQTWNFQYWYRDPQGPCHGLTNFSNGVQVAFTP